MKRGLSVLLALLLFTACGTPAILESSAAPPSIPPQASQTSPSSALESTADTPREWDSLFAFQWNGEVLGWYNATADPETLRELTDIIGAVKAQPPSEYQGAPDGGYPIELEFRAGDEIKCR